MVMRHMMQSAGSVDDAIAIAKNAERTWGIWLGVGQSAPVGAEDRPFQVGEQW
jgi:hypothetical protein